MYHGSPSGARPGVIAQLEKAAALHRAGSLVQARTLYQRVLILQPRNTEALRLLGALSLTEKKFDEAIKYLQKATLAQPKSAEAHYGLGDALQSTGDLEAACASYRTALALRPKFWEALCNLGNALFALQRHHEASATFAEALELRPHDLTVQANLKLARELEAQAVDDAAFAAEVDQLVMPNA